MNEIVIREAASEDAAEILAYLKKVGAETNNLIFGAEGMPVTVKDEENYIQSVKNDPHSVMYAAVKNGKCTENCMLHNIELKNGKPVWNGMCTHCMACICKCPTEAIEYGRHTIGLTRYVCKE